MDDIFAFDRLGAPVPTGPVVLSVPHAGRAYPPILRSALRVSVEALRPLEDRFVDRVARAARTTETMLVQRTPRTWIDLNRGEDDRDSRLDSGADPRGIAMQTPKLRSGLGIVPRLVPVAGEIWRRRLDGDEVVARIAACHRPYHAALEDALTAARARFGTAVLLDIHSMPSLGAGRARIVLGDRFGRAAAPRFVERAEAELRAAGMPSALNAPYAGGHILERHGAPVRGIHAIQIELDRTLYLDASLDQPGPGLADTAALLRRVIAALADEALAAPTALAAE